MECVGFFPVHVMAVISLASFVVVADERDAISAIIEAVFVAVTAARQRFRQFPDDELQDTPVIPGQLAVHDT